MENNQKWEIGQIDLEVGGGIAFKRRWKSPFINGKTAILSPNSDHTATSLDNLERAVVITLAIYSTKSILLHIFVQKKILKSNVKLEV